MAVTLLNSGTVTPVVGVENFLQNANAAGSYTFHVSLFNLTSSDSVTLNIYQEILTGDAPLLAYTQTYPDALGVPFTAGSAVIAISVPISNDLTDATSLRFSLNQTVGTARAYKWKVLKYA